jgi:hypothetical protein
LKKIFSKLKKILFFLACCQVIQPTTKSIWRFDVNYYSYVRLGAGVHCSDTAIKTYYSNSGRKVQLEFQKELKFFIEYPLERSFLQETCSIYN